MFTNRNRRILSQIMFIASKNKTTSMYARNIANFRSDHNHDRSQALGRTAHQWGWSATAWIPLCTIRYLRSCNRGSASLVLAVVVTFPATVDEYLGPVQKTSDVAAARGHTMLSRLLGLLCSLHSSCLFTKRNLSSSHTDVGCAACTHWPPRI